MTLWIGSNRITLKWTPKNFQSVDNIDQSLNTKTIPLDHNYAFPPKEIPFEEDYHDIEYSEFFDHDGKWLKRHVRRLIHVMDSFRISNEAYHEIRMVSKGQLPPIGTIRKEKKIMSHELPYIKHPKV